MTASAPHIPVLLDAVLSVMPCAADKVIVDGTFGAGGYTTAMLAAGTGKLYAIDRDPSVQAFAKPLSEKYGDRFSLLQGSFSEMEQLLAAKDVDAVDGIVLDLGVSSMQLDQPERGFSFRFDGPLDMRMGDQGPTAADIVNDFDETELANIIYKLGEERRSRQVANAIVRARADKRIETTFELAEIIRPVVRKGASRKSHEKIDPATRTFMALRLYVNDELGEVERALSAAERLLKPNGILAVVSFHSLEDRIVKLFFRDRATPPGVGSRHLPAPIAHIPPVDNRPPNTPPMGQGDAAPLQTFQLDKAIGSTRGMTASDTELEQNPRARSARLRAAIRTQAPAREVAA